MSEEPVQNGEAPPKKRRLSDDRRAEIGKLYTVGRLGVVGLYRSQLPRMAAALAYRTIFSVIPVMALGLLILGAFVSEEDVDDGVRRVLEFAGISQIAVAPIESEPVELQGPLPEGADPDQAGPVGAEPSGNDLEQVISDLINRVNTSIKNVPTGWIAIASVLVLIYAAMSMLIEIEKSFNQLCAAPAGRPWLRRLMLYWTMLTLGTLLLAATFLAGDALAGWIRSISGEKSSIGAAFAGFGVSVLITTALLFAFYLTIPNTTIKLRPALAGAFLGAVLWEIGKSLFTLYLREATGYTKFYGSLAILPLFLMWVYLTWIIVLLGMQATYALQHFSRLVASGLASLASEGSEGGPRILDPLVMVAAAQVLAESFDSGGTVTVDTLSEKLDLEPSITERLVHALRRRGVINELASGEDEDDVFALARPASQIKVADLIEAANDLDLLRTRESRLVPDSLLRASTLQAGDAVLADLERPRASD